LLSNNLITLYIVTSTKSINLYMIQTLVKKGGIVMILKKSTVFFLVLMMLLALPVSAFAHHGDKSGWQYVGTFDVSEKSEFYTKLFGGGSRYRSTSILNSGGGSVQFCSVSGVNSYRVYEEDPYDGDDDFIGYVDLYGTGRCDTLNVSKFVDGSNKHAEIYLVGTYNDKGKVKFYD
jgi:hypothetical protein